MTRINQYLGRPSTKLQIQMWIVLLLVTCVFTFAKAATTVRTIKLLRPLNGATVRETVPIRISPADLPEDGYVTVSIDKIFRTANLIEPNSSLIYTWDTQSPFQDPNNPGTDQFTQDGPHEIEISVYDHQGDLLATGASTVRIANSVTNLPDGVKLSYNWSQDQTLRYRRHSELDEVGGASTSGASTEIADIRFARTVEDSTGDDYLVRDRVYPDGVITEQGTPTPVQTLFDLKSCYRTVDRFGAVITEDPPFTSGDHFGFSIADLPPRRITVGDSWQSKIEVSLTWANTKPTVLLGTARLDSFEWQDGYPTAKVIENYDGPATFYADDRGTVSFQADNVHLVRTYWFAYNSKRLVRSTTDMTVDGNVSPDVVAAVGSVGTSIAGAAGGGAIGGGGGIPGMPNLPAGFTPTPAEIAAYEKSHGIAAGTVPNFGNADNGGGGATGGATVPLKLHVKDDTSLLGV